MLALSVMDEPALMVIAICLTWSALMTCSISSWVIVPMKLCTSLERGAEPDMLGLGYQGFQVGYDASWLGVTERKRYVKNNREDGGNVIEMNICSHGNRVARLSQIGKVSADQSGWLTVRRSIFNLGGSPVSSK